MYSQTTVIRNVAATAWAEMVNAVTAALTPLIEAASKSTSIMACTMAFVYPGMCDQALDSIICTQLYRCIESYVMYIC